MTDIPEDVMKAARAAFVSCGFALSGDMRVRCEIVAAYAILADRKRRVVAKELRRAEGVHSTLGWVLSPVLLDDVAHSLRANQGRHVQRKDVEPIMLEAERRILATLEFTDEHDPRLAAAEADAERLAEALRRLAPMRAGLMTDVSSAHRIRGDAASEWMREDDREFRSDLHRAFDAIESALAAHEARKGERHE